MDGSHITIIAPRLHAPDYYNRKGFHSVLMQGVVSAKCLFWDFDIGWACSMYDANIWSRTAIGQYCKANKLWPYNLIGDAVNPLALGCWHLLRATKMVFLARSNIGTLSKVHYGCVLNERSECLKVDGESR